MRCRLLAVLLATGLTACGQQDPATPPSASPPAPPPAAAEPSVPPGGFGPTEQAFTQLAISTDDQAVRLLDLGARRAANPALRAFAGELATTRRAELESLHGLLDAASVPYQNLHEGHDMPGMPTDAELTGLASSAAFDTELTRLVRAHLTESATVARSAATQVTHEPTKAVAAAMATERAAALTRLASLN
ncbi:DUF305 domain-containing protein [Actinophytocola xanthii]|uniref:DUF305 domain-containing protein n=1 Tax=Actinophytocola xanthii TaxID=1912961 RepID=A0A1Q8CC09_9PSEU|nr:DUF305 domain-containing protein [Actinophytocola xanthii]OLF11895.1 hypothetical protein BU204_29415 [Actinophytocola xanthii]